MSATITPIRPQTEHDEHPSHQKDAKGSNFSFQLTWEERITALCAMLVCVTVLMLVFQCLRWDINPKPAYVPANYSTTQDATIQ